MNDIGDAIGTGAEGALVSKAVEDERVKPLVKGHFAERACLNCGTELIGSHCHACGQKAHLHRTIAAFMHDLLHGALHFEGKIWRTLPKLMFKPGELTRRYVEGERAHFVSPMALFLFVIFLMFAVFQLAGLSAPAEFNTESQVANMDEVRENARKELQAAVTEAEEQEPGGAQTAETERRIAEARDTIEELDSIARFEIAEDSEITLTGIAAIDEGIIAKWRKNPSLMFYKLQTNFYKFSWLLIPLSTPFVWLLFAWHRKFKAYDHAIFVTYSLSFVTLLILATTLAGLAGTPPVLLTLALTVVPMLHLYKQLRGAYGISRFSALWRLCVLTIFILIVLMLFLQMLLLLGAF